MLHEKDHRSVHSVPVMGVSMEDGEKGWERNSRRVWNDEEEVVRLSECL